ncbi:MAG: ISL3 family transposase, partial [Desulfoferrobacter sp.]
KKTFLHFLARRFFCDQCQSVFSEQLSFVDPHRRQRLALELHIYQRCLASTMKAVARSECLSYSTVKEIFRRWAKSKSHGGPNVYTRVLGIDEISLKKRHKQFALVLSDIERKCVIDVLANREKETLEQWLAALGEPQRKAIRFVSIDMWVPYRQAVRTQLPEAKLIVDRFHVMKQLNSRLSQVRRSVQKSVDTETQATLKGSRWLLMRNRCELSIQQEQHLQAILRACPQLRTLYLLKEQFRTVFNKVLDRNQAERFLKAWIWHVADTRDRFLMKFVSTLTNWWEEILNYFPTHITNGCVEGINGAIRNIIRKAFGYRNFNNFRNMVLAQHGLHTNSP